MLSDRRPAKIHERDASAIAESIPVRCICQGVPAREGTPHKERPEGRRLFHKRSSLIPFVVAPSNALCHLQEKHIGLIHQAIDRAPRWLIQKLTSTYLTLGLADIAKEVGLDGEEEVRSIIFSMVRPSLLRLSSTEADAS